MSLSHKRDNILFCIFLLLVILIAVLITYLLINNHKKNKLNNNVHFDINEIKEFKFKDVTEADVVDVFTKYPINPIDINFANNSVSISGLKDKNVEDKINKKLMSLDSSKNEYGFNDCNVLFNYSNVLSLYCKEDVVTVNLINGEDIILEEVFQKGSDLYSLFWGSLYEGVCLYVMEEQSENCMAKGFNTIRSGNYSLKIGTTYLELDNNNYDSPYVGYSDAYSDLTIYNRFLTDKDLYINEVKDYCYPQSCDMTTYDSGEIDQVYRAEFLSEKNYLVMSVINGTDMDLFGEQTEVQDLDMKVIFDNMKNDFIKKYDLNNQNTNYKYIYIDAYIHSSTKTYNQIEYMVSVDEYNKENFQRHLLGDYYADTKKEIYYNGINLGQYFDGTLKFLESNPNNIFVDFEKTLYNYILDEIRSKGENSNFYGIAYCEQTNSKECKNSINEIIKKSVYSIDKNEKKLYMSYREEYGFIIHTKLPFNNFVIKNQ